MSLFIPSAPTPQHKGPTTDILVLNDYRDADCLRLGKKMGSAQLGVLEACLHMANMTKGDISIINLFPDRINTDNVWVYHAKASKRFFLPAGKAYIQAVNDLIEMHKPKVVVTLGNIATQALLERTDCSDIRGYPFPKGESIIIPALHPRDMIWGNAIWKFYLSMDLRKAADYASGKRKIVMPNLYILNEFTHACTVLENLWLAHKPISVDIEVSNYEVSCIGFSNEENIAFSLPIDTRWSEVEEAYLWRQIAYMLEDPGVPKVFQNGIFDVYFLIYKNNIFTQGYIDDTMMSHSVSYPDFLKGLGFLGSVYTDYTYWKDEMDYKLIKREA